MEESYKQMQKSQILTFLVVMPYQRILAVDKQRLYDAYRRNEDYVELARQLGIKRTTALAIIKRAEDKQGRVTRPRGALRLAYVKVSKETVETILATSEQHLEYTLEQINAEMRFRLPHCLQINRS